MPKTQTTATINLRDWLLKQKKPSFPGAGKRDYTEQFQGAERFLFEEVHPEVEKLAMTVDGGYLTDHGPMHIRTVIDRASHMIGHPNDHLSPYEVYILLMAIHLHDVGNIYGRKGHEKKLGEVVKAVESRLGSDSVETRMIRQVAEAHGGKTPDGRVADTIGGLKADHSLGHDVRLQLLAAILRFADELADDKNRASRLALWLGRLPPEAEIYHQYAKSLDSVKVRRDLRLVELRFALDGEIACKTFEKDGGGRYLLDEIYSRTMKMHFERLYCSRFMGELVRLDAINVKISVFRDVSDISPFEEVKYSLRESGYPDVPSSISALVPDLTTGKKLRRRLLKAIKAGSK